MRWVAAAVLLALAWISCTSSGSGEDSTLQADSTLIVDAIPGVRDIRLEAANWSFAPNDITVAPGESIRFIVTNTWTVAHTFTFDDSGSVWKGWLRRWQYRLLPSTRPVIIVHHTAATTGRIIEF